jgi:hypothetical protein
MSSILQSVSRTSYFLSRRTREMDIFYGFSDRILAIRVTRRKAKPRPVPLHRLLVLMRREILDAPNDKRLCV